MGAAGYAMGAAGYATGEAGYATVAAGYATGAAGYAPGAADYAPCFIPVRSVAGAVAQVLPRLGYGEGGLREGAIRK